MSTEIQELTPQEAQEMGLIPTFVSDEQLVEESFQLADGHYWNEVRLDPYSAQRQIAAQSLGMRFGSLTKEDLEEIDRTASYPGMIQDALIVLYLCYPRGKRGNEGIEESYAACDPGSRKALRKRMMDFAEAQGIEVNSAQSTAAVGLMLAIVKEAKLNQFKPAPAKGRVPPGN